MGGGGMKGEREREGERGKRGRERLSARELVKI